MSPSQINRYPAVVRLREPVRPTRNLCDDSVAFLAWLETNLRDRDMGDVFNCTVVVALVAGGPKFTASRRLKRLLRHKSYTVVVKRVYVSASYSFHAVDDSPRRCRYLQQHPVYRLVQFLAVLHQSQATFIIPRRRRHQCSDCGLGASRRQQRPIAPPGSQTVVSAVV